MIIKRILFYYLHIEWFFLNDDLEFFDKVIKYFISIGINVGHQNKDGNDAFLYSIEYGNFELIKYIGSLMQSLKSSADRYDIKSYSFQNAIYNLLKCFNIEMIKYLDEFPCFANYFDGENKIRSKNSILFNFISFYLHFDGIKFSKFKEIFEYCLNINSIDKFNRIPIQYDFKFLHNYSGHNKGAICWKFWNYFIEKE